MLQARARTGRLRGAVILVFQPAEEGKGGGQSMVAGGALRGATAAAGLHVWPDLPSGI